MSTRTNRKKQTTDETRNKIISKYLGGKTPKLISEELDVNYETTRSVINLYKKQAA
jgi:hypothetical protein